MNPLYDQECINDVSQTRPDVFSTLKKLIRQTCNCKVWDNFQPRTNRLNPINEINTYNDNNITLNTKLNFENTKHRYSWICSLRVSSPFTTSFHNCAVTLFSKPPKPTVLVTSAHCTYICKSNKGVVDNCCCDNVAEISCSSGSYKCYSNKISYSSRIKFK